MKYFSYAAVVPFLVELGEFEQRPSKEELARIAKHTTRIRNYTAGLIFTAEDVAAWAETIQATFSQRTTEQIHLLLFGLNINTLKFDLVSENNNVFDEDAFSASSDEVYVAYFAIDQIWALFSPLRLVAYNDDFTLPEEFKANALQEFFSRD